MLKKRIRVPKAHNSYLRDAVLDVPNETVQAAARVVKGHDETLGIAREEDAPTTARMLSPSASTPWLTADLVATQTARIRSIGRACRLRPHEVEDLEQDVLCVLHLASPPPADVTCWVSRVSRRRANRIRQRRQRREKVEVSYHMLGEIAGRVPKMPSRVGELGDVLDATEIQLIELFFAGIARDQIPALTGMSHRAFRRRWNRLEEKLREWVRS